MGPALVQIKEINHTHTHTPFFFFFLIKLDPQLARSHGEVFKLAQLPKKNIPSAFGEIK